MPLIMPLTCKITNACKKIGTYAYSYELSDNIKIDWEKIIEWNPNVLKFKGIANHLGWMWPCISLYELPMQIFFGNLFLPMWVWTNIG